MKINITKPTGSVDNFDLLTAFKIEGNTYVIFDSERVGSMGLPIIYISNFNDEKLVKIDNTSDEWQNVKNYLKGIINGANFEYIKVNGNLQADEAYYTPLTLPQASFDLIKKRYVIKEEDNNSDGDMTVMDLVNEAVPNESEVVPIAPATNEGVLDIATDSQSVVSPVSLEVNNTLNTEAVSLVPDSNLVGDNNNSILEPNNVTPVVPVMPNPNVSSNEDKYVAPAIDVTPTINNIDSNIVPNMNVSETVPYNVEVAPVQNTAVEPVITPNALQSQNVSPEVPNINVPQDTVSSVMNQAENIVTNETIIDENNLFSNDKDTFMKACENMFDALVSKYQKKLQELESREQLLNNKEQEIEQKLKNANEYLANAAARETVANIAHDNAKKVMDMNNVMPNNQVVNQNPTGTQTGVI